jgi:hypothetical protein
MHRLRFTWSASISAVDLLTFFVCQIVDKMNTFSGLGAIVMICAPNKNNALGVF